jgi:3-oxoacyl-[acyl-carrier-protein] synthase III
MAPGAAAALVTTSLNAGVSYLDRCRSAGSGTVLGDGAAAAVLGKDYGIARVDALNSVMFAELEALHRGDASLLDTDSGVRESVDMLSRSHEMDPRLKGSETDGMQTSIDLQRLFTRAYVDVMRRGT